MRIAGKGGIHKKEKKAKWAAEQAGSVARHTGGGGRGERVMADMPSS